MEFWTIVDNITALAVMILSVLGIIAMVFVVVLCVRGNKLMKTANNTVESIQELTHIPMQIVNTLIQKFLG